MIDEDFIEVLLTRDETVVSLYPIRALSAIRERPWGRADFVNAIWTGFDAEGTKIGKAFERLNHRPTGTRFPRMRDGAETHRISFTKVFGIYQQLDPVVDQIVDTVRLDRDAIYIMSIVWQEGAPKPVEESRWYARIYYGVSIPSVDLNSSELEFEADQVFEAWFYKEKNGVGLVDLGDF